MKPINTKESMLVYGKMEKTLSYFHFCSDAVIRGLDYYKTDLEKARADVKSIREEYEATLLPITEAIKAAEGRATARLLSADALISTLADITEKLNISKKAMEGIRVEVDVNARTFPNAYRYTPESTQFSAEYKAGSWRINSIMRASVMSPSRAVVIYHTEASKAALLERFTAFSL